MLKSKFIFLVTRKVLKVADEYFTLASKAVLLGWLLGIAINDYHLQDKINNWIYMQEAEEIFELFNSQKKCKIKEDSIPEGSEVA